MTNQPSDHASGSEVPTALIVGAGIGGLAAGIALRHAGWRVRIFERASSPRELGFALNLAPNAVAALKELGLADRVTSLGHVVTSGEIREPGRGVLKRMQIDGLSARATPTVVASRQALHGTLLEIAGRDTVDLESAVDGFEQRPTGVTLHCANGATADGDVLIGADGVNSVIRARLHPSEAAPRTSPYVAVRALSRGSAAHLGGVSSIAYLGAGLETAAVEAGGGDVYWYMSLLAAELPAPLSAADAGKIARERARDLDADYRAIVDATAPADVRLDALTDRPPLAHWGNGRVTLLGDAAHPMLPHAGQGAAQALEDAIALGLSLNPRQDLDIPAGLRRYELLRAARTGKIVARARHIAGMTTTRRQATIWLRRQAIRLAPAALMAKAFLLTDDDDVHHALRSPRML